ncbi:MAG TPA: hypothetical protein VER11_34210 [Polyangiaceae bacterium]|nr:hypothetical protein [Polyangiaceae bacterium]
MKTQNAWSTSFDRPTLVWTARLGDVEASGLTERIAKTALAAKLGELRGQLERIAGAV